MTPRVIVAKAGREYLCWPEADGRWRCGRCRRGFLHSLPGSESAACSVCRAELIAVLPPEPGMPPPVSIPPAGQVLTQVDAKRVPHGWDVTCVVRALRGEHPGGTPLTKAAAAVLAWQALSVAIRQGGNDLNAMVAKLDAASLPEEHPK